MDETRALLYGIRDALDYLRSKVDQIDIRLSKIEENVVDLNGKMDCLREDVHALQLGQKAFLQDLHEQRIEIMKLKEPLS